MAFCTKCGKPLQDGEVCLCQSAAQPPVTPVTPVTPAQVTPATPVTPAQVAPVQETVIYQPAQPNAFVVFIKGLWAIVIGVLKTPVTTINTYVQKADAKIACTLIGLSALVTALIKWFELLQFNSKVSNSIDYENLSMSDLTDLYKQYTGTSSSSSSSAKYSSGEIFKQMCLSALLVIVAAAAIALVIMVAVNTYGKAKTTYVQGLAIVSLMEILTIPAVILAYIFGLFGVVFFSELGIWITVFASAVGAIYIFLGVRVVCKDENKLPFIAGLSAVGASIATYLIGLMF